MLCFSFKRFEPCTRTWPSLTSPTWGARRTGRQPAVNFSKLCWRDRGRRCVLVECPFLRGVNKCTCEIDCLLPGSSQLPHVPGVPSVGLVTQHMQSLAELFQPQESWALKSEPVGYRSVGDQIQAPTSLMFSKYLSYRCFSYL